MKVTAAQRALTFAHVLNACRHIYQSERDKNMWTNHQEPSEGLTSSKFQNLPLATRQPRVKKEKSLYLYSASMADGEEEINLSDCYVVLLEDSLKESRSFREETKSRDEETRKVLSNLSNRVDQLCQMAQQQATQPELPTTSGSYRSRAKLIVPRVCRVCTYLFFFIQTLVHFYKNYPFSDVFLAHIHKAKRCENAWHRASKFLCRIV